MLKQITEIDFAILDFIHIHYNCDFLDFLMPLVSFLGNGGFIWILMAVIFILRKNNRKLGKVLLVGLAVGFVVGNLILKPWIARPRPNWLNEKIILLIDNPLDFSFPSGHTLSSFVSAILISMNNKKAAYVVIPFACIMAFSRLYLYVHYPSDVFASVALSFVISFVVHKAFYRTNKIN